MALSPFLPLFLSGHTKASGAAPKSAEVQSRGDQTRFWRAKRTYLEGRILTGGAEKAERKRLPGAARQRFLPSSEAVPERKRGREGKQYAIE